MAESKFVKVTATQGTGTVPHVFALDESGRVWEYDFNHKRWRSLGETREPMFTR